MAKGPKRQSRTIWNNLENSPREGTFTDLEIKRCSKEKSSLLY